MSSEQLCLGQEEESKPHEQPWICLNIVLVFSIKKPTLCRDLWNWFYLIFCFYLTFLAQQADSKLILPCGLLTGRKTFKYSILYISVKELFMCAFLS